MHHLGRLAVKERQLRGKPLRTTTPRRAGKKRCLFPHPQWSSEKSVLSKNIAEAQGGHQNQQDPRRVTSLTRRRRSAVENVIRSTRERLRNLSGLLTIGWIKRGWVFHAVWVKDSIAEFESIAGIFPCNGGDEPTIMGKFGFRGKRESPQPRSHQGFLGSISKAHSSNGIQCRREPFLEDAPCSTGVSDFLRKSVRDWPSSGRGGCAHRRGAGVRHRRGRSRS